MELEQFKYPIGKFQRPESISTEMLKEWTETIKNLPAQLTKEVENLSDAQLDTPYRPEGWTVRQLVHHFADSHLNSFMRFKLALTEDKPTIKAYNENLWADLSDSKNFPISSSLKMVEGIHERWVALLETIMADDFKKTFYHPDRNIYYPLDVVTGLYAWHCKHHLAHITRLKERENW